MCSHWCICFRYITFATVHHLPNSRGCAWILILWRSPPFWWRIGVCLTLPFKLIPVPLAYGIISLNYSCQVLWKPLFETDLWFSSGDAYFHCTFYPFSMLPVRWDLKYIRYSDLLLLCFSLLFHLFSLLQEMFFWVAFTIQKKRRKKNGYFEGMHLLFYLLMLTFMLV